jgi:ParB-like chromosome segregation protein Spo0J
VWALETWPAEMLAGTIHHHLDQSKISGLMSSIAEGFPLPPVFVLMADGVVKILDGHHRVAAWLRSGMTGIPVIVGRVR